jgi:hypothetical protein
MKNQKAKMIKQGLKMRILEKLSIVAALDKVVEANPSRYLFLLFHL